MLEAKLKFEIRDRIRYNNLSSEIIDLETDQDLAIFNEVPGRNIEEGFSCSDNLRARQRENRKKAALEAAREIADQYLQKKEIERGCSPEPGAYHPTAAVFAFGFGSSGGVEEISKPSASTRDKSECSISYPAPRLVDIETEEDSVTESASTPSPRITGIRSVPAP